jgi:hypothetical protein
MQIDLTIVLPAFFENPELDLAQLPDISAAIDHVASYRGWIMTANGVGAAIALTKCPLDTKIERAGILLNTNRNLAKYLRGKQAFSEYLRVMHRDVP